MRHLVGYRGYRALKRRRIKPCVLIIAGLIIGFLLGCLARQTDVKTNIYIESKDMAGEEVVVTPASPMDLTGADFVGDIPAPYDGEREAKMFIYHRESGNNPSAINKTSGACGLGQALPCSKMNCKLGDYECQDRWFTGYMQRRYGSWQKAKTFWLKNKYW